MATCENCIHRYCCKENYTDRFWHQTEVENKCNYFKHERNIKEFPFDIGDKVYIILEDCDTPPFVDEGKVFALRIDEKLTKWISVRYESGLKYYYTPDDFGKDAFTSKVDAEKALENANKEWESKWGFV